MSAILETTGTAIAEFVEHDQQLNKFVELYDDVVYDLTDPEVDKTARSDKHSIGKAISKLDARHKELKAPLKAQTDLLDTERKRIKDGLLDVQGKIKLQIESHESAIREKEEKLQGMVEEIRDLTVFISDATGGAFLPAVTDVQQRLNIIKNIEVDDAYEHRKADATLAYVDAIRELESQLELAIEREHAAAELEQLRQEKEEREQQDRDEAIRKEAEAKAAQEAEQKVQDAQRQQREAEDKAKQAEEQQKAAEARAEQDKKDAVEKAKAIALQEAAYEQQMKDKAAAQTKRCEEIEIEKEQAKKAKVRHRQRIHREAKESFREHGITEKEAKRLVELIKDGLVANVFLDY